MLIFRRRPCRKPLTVHRWRFEGQLAERAAWPGGRSIGSRATRLPPSAPAGTENGSRCSRSGLALPTPFSSLPTSASGHFSAKSVQHSKPKISNLNRAMRKTKCWRLRGRQRSAINHVGWPRGRPALPHPTLVFWSAKMIISATCRRSLPMISGFGKSGSRTMPGRATKVLRAG